MPRVGLLARGVKKEVFSRFTFPDPTIEWLSKQHARTYSGGTAPDSHRTSLLCPLWAPQAFELLLNHKVDEEHDALADGFVIFCGLCGQGL